MAWYIDSTRIFVIEKSSDYKQIIARLQPLAGPSVHQVFAYESPVFKISAYVVGEGDLANVISMYNDGLTHVFSGPVGFADFFVNSLNVKDQKAAYQTIRPDLDCEATVYLCDLELYMEEA